MFKLLSALFKSCKQILGGSKVEVKSEIQPSWTPVGQSLVWHPILGNLFLEFSSWFSVMQSYHSNLHRFCLVGLPVLFNIIIIIVITIYTHTDTFMTNMSNATPERFYNSFEGTVWLNVAQAVLGPLFIAIIIPIFICCLIIKKNRQGIRHYGF